MKNRWSTFAAGLCVLALSVASQADEDEPNNAESGGPLAVSRSPVTNLLGMSLIPTANALAVATEVTPATPAWEAGIRSGDEVVGVGDLRPTSFQEFGDSARKLIAVDKPTVLQIRMRRGKDEYVAKIPIEPKPRTEKERPGKPRGTNMSDNRETTAKLFEVRRSRDAAGFREVGEVRFRAAFTRTIVEVDVRGLTAGNYKVAVLNHGDLDHLHRRSAARPATSEIARQNASRPDDNLTASSRSQIALGDLIVNAEGRGKLTQRLDKVQPEKLAGLMVAIFPARPGDNANRTRAEKSAQQTPAAVAAGVVGYAVAVQFD